MSKAHGVICYWKFVPKKRPYEDKWELVESYACDDDGYPIYTPKNTSGGGDRHEFMKWLQTSSRANDDFDPEPIMGRAVTLWTVDGGVQLLGFNPPQWIDWLSPSFYEKIRENGLWRTLLEGAGTLWLGTGREADKYVTIKDKT